MNVPEKAKHRDCFYYEDNKRPTVEIRDLEPGHREETVFHKNEIVFMIKGKVSFIFSDHPERTLDGGKFIFIPLGRVFRYKVLEEARVIVVRLNSLMKLCAGYRIEDLYKRGGSLPGDYSPDISPLEINRLPRYFLDGLYESVSRGLNCRYYFDLKAGELLILLNTFYPREELREFFSLILTPDAVFSEYVREHYLRFRTIGELAASMNLSAKHFEKQFTRVFGISPGRWINGEKAQMIYHELRSGAKSLKEITYEYGFANQQQLNRFCKRELKRNPGEIRRDEKGEINEVKR